MQQRPILAGPAVHLVASQQQLASVLHRHGGAAGTHANWGHMRDAAGVTWSLEIDDLPVWIVGLNLEHVRTGFDAVSTLVHEATHVKQGYMEHIGEASPSAEFEAYTMQTITENLLQQWDALVAKSRPKRRVGGKAGKGAHR